MNPVVKYFFLSLFSLQVICYNIDSQDVQGNHYSLDLTDSDRVIENTISLYISGLDYKAIRETTGQKVDIKTIKLIINGDIVKPESISTRGQSTLQFKKKSLHIRLNSEASFRHGEKTESFKKFFVLSLSMDKYYSHDRLAFEMMEELKIFDLFYTFCELRINDKSEGICMVIERPEDWAIKRKKSPLMIRRGYDHKIDKIEKGKKVERSETKEYINHYSQIYRSLYKYEGEELYKILSEWIDLDIYMKWLAFNLLVRNGDYSDEVFFYVDPDNKKFRIIPWDYDDLFALAPHEGNVERQNVIGDKLLFSVEDQLDKKIATDPYLYKIYLARIKEVLDILSLSVLKRIFENTFDELYPYYANKETISNSQNVFYKEANLENLKSDMIMLYIGLNYARDRYLEYLESMID